MELNKEEYLARQSTKPDPWGGDVDRAIKAFVSAAEDVYRACYTLEACAGIRHDPDVVHVCNAGNGVIIKAKETAKKMEQSLKDYRISQIQQMRK